MSCVSNQKNSTNLFLDVRLDFDIHKLGHVDSVCYALINLLLVRLRLKLSIFDSSFFNLIVDITKRGGSR